MLNLIKADNIKTNVRMNHTGGIKDNRKYINDPTLSEAQKLSRRIALENMVRSLIFLTDLINSLVRKEKVQISYQEIQISYF